MKQNFKDIMECLLGEVLYHGRVPEEPSWCEEYEHEVSNMMQDIKEFYRSSTDAGLEVSDEAIAHFLIYTERQHIGNAHFVNSCAVDKLQLLAIAAEINNELKRHKEYFDVKYAVSLYGIRQDTYKDNDSSIKIAGLTFGPATGSSYVYACASHTPTGVTASGNPHRCIHDDDWETIAYWSKKDPYVYEQCIDGGGSGESCTKSVPIVLSDKIKRTSYPNMSGDGAGILYDCIKLDYRRWNAYKNSRWTNKGGWPAARIRSTLNGRQPETTEVAWEDTASGEYQVTEDKLCTEADSLLAGFPAVLKEAIVPKAVKSDTVYNNVSGNNMVTYDKLWLLSGAEAYVDSGSNNSVIRPNEGTPYERITALGITTSNYDANKGYYESGSTNSRWLRSANRIISDNEDSVYSSGDWSNNVVHYTNGLAPGFCIR